jgi:hypothetical protein
MRTMARREATVRAAVITALLSGLATLGCSGDESGEGQAGSAGSGAGSGGAGNGGAGATAGASAGSGGSGASSGAGGSSAGTGGSNGGTGGSPPACTPVGEVPPGHHVAVQGSASGDGSAANPWDLPTALQHPSVVKPGDTIYLHGGVYTGTYVAKLVGTEASPITLRSYPGEWATLDSAGSDAQVLQIYKEHTIFRDFEVTNTGAVRTGGVSRPSGIYVEGKNIRLVNLIVHDVGTGIISNSASDTLPELAPELEVYGCLLYANGYEDVDRGHGHHLYLQNRDGTKRIRDNVLAYAFGFGVHAYSDTDTYYAQNYEIEGNVWLQNGAATSGESKLYDGCMVGHNGTHPVRGLVLRSNFGWAAGPGERDVRLGWSAANEDAKLFDNTIVGQTIFQPSWSSLELSGNTFYGELVGADPSAYPSNTYLSARPTENWVFVRPNAEQTGRAHVIVYNWTLADSMDIDLSSVLEPGSDYEVRNAQDYFAAPVVSGTYSGGSVSIPLANLGVAQPIGLDGAILASEQPGKEFAVFVVIGRCG